MTPTRILLLTGWQDAGAGHWQSHWERRHGFERLQQDDWWWPRRGDWMARLEDALLADPRPTVLVAHGLACHLVAAWAGHSRQGRLVSAALLVAPRARAADVEGVIVALDGGELVVDLGALRGAHEGDVVELWRPLQLRHPLTGRPLVERFRTGALRLTQVRPALALATVEGTPSRAPAAGDIVVLHRESPAPPAKPPSSTKPPRPAATADPYEDLASKPPPAGSAPAPVTSAPAVPPGSAPAPGADPEADALATMLTELTGAPPAVRAARYRAFTLRWPVGRSVRVLNEEAAMLQSIDATLPRGTSPSFDAPRATLAGRPLSLAIELPGNSVGAVVNVRSAGETTYQTVPMKAAGPG